MWFSESEDSKVSDALSQLAATQGLDNHLLYQVEKKYYQVEKEVMLGLESNYIRWIVIKVQTIL